MGSFALSEGQLVKGRYRVLRKLGSGGMGAVYEVLDPNTNRLRALKVMLPGLGPDTDLIERFHKEATVAGRVESDHVVEVFDAGFDDDLSRAYLVMELLRGEDLGARIARERLEPAEVVECLTQVALGLSRTHAEGIVHRDLKPENLFATRRDDGSLRMKILDFGIAKVMTPLSGAPNTTRAFGTPTYMAPEQLEGDALIDERADLYALGHLAYTLLAGEAYFAADHKAAKNVFAYAQVVQRGVTEPASVRAARAGVKLPPAFDAWFERATQIDPQARFGSAVEQIAALAQALDLPAEPAPVAPARARSGARRARPYHRGLRPSAPSTRSLAALARLIAIAIVALLVAFGAIGLLQHRVASTPMPVLERSLPAVNARAIVPLKALSASKPSADPPSTEPNTTAEPSSSAEPHGVQPARVPRRPATAAASSAAKPYDPLDDL